MAVFRCGWHDGWHERDAARRCRRLKSSRSAASCWARRASTRTRCTSPSGSHALGIELQRRRPSSATSRARSPSDPPARARPRRPGHPDRRPRPDRRRRDARRVADVLGLPLIEHPDIVERLEQRFARRGLHDAGGQSAPGAGRRAARSSPNPNGTAPGQMVEVGTALVVLLPGPPRELQPMMERSSPGALARAGRSRAVVPHDALHGRARGVARRGAGPAGLLAVAAGDAADRDDDPRRARSDRAAPRAAIGGRGSGRPRARARRATRSLGVLGADVFSTDGRSMEEVVGQLLLERRLTIAAAESCTGGLLMSRLTDVPGSSTYVAGGVVAYSNASKDEPARRAGGAHRRTRRGQRAGRGRAGRRHSSADRRVLGVGITGIAGPAAERRRSRSARWPSRCPPPTV